MGLGLVGPVQLGDGSGAERVTGRGHRALVAAWRVRAHRWPTRDNVFAWTTGAESGRRRARRGPVGLTEVASRQRVAESARDSDVLGLVMSCGGR
jgi:hypothetical protein